MIALTNFFWACTTCQTSLYCSVLMGVVYIDHFCGIPELLLFPFHDFLYISTSLWTKHCLMTVFGLWLNTRGKIFKEPDKGIKGQRSQQRQPGRGPLACWRSFVLLLLAINNAAHWVPAAFMSCNTHCKGLQLHSWSQRDHEPTRRDE